MDARALLPTFMALTALLSGCSSSDDDAAEEGQQGFDRVLSEVRGLEGAERAKKLAAMAKAEGGELTFYTSLVSDTEDAVADEFEDAYDVEVSVYRASGETVAQRVSEEAKADFRGADVVETGGPEMAGLTKEGLFVSYRPDGADELVEGSVQKGWTAVRFNTFVVAWNTELVPKGTEPRSYEELADPRWKGKLVIEEEDADWYKAMLEHLMSEGKSEAEAEKVMEGIAANAQVATSHSLMSQLLSAGEFALSPDQYQYQVKDAQDDGAPLTNEPFVEPVFPRPQGMALMKTAKHPAAAVLFADWLVGPGQEVLAESNQEASRKDLSLSQGAERKQIDVVEFESQTKEWDDRYEKLISGAPKAPEPE